jgi:hypothetical protein
MPVRREADLDSERGRGLLLVETLSRDWGTYRTADGKVVWLCHGHGKGLLCRKGF